MADNKQDQGKQDMPRAGDIKPFGSGVQSSEAGKGDADKAHANKSQAEVTPKTGGQGHDGPRADETVPGGAYIVDGVVRNANGEELKDYEVKDGRAVKKGDAAK